MGKKKFIDRKNSATFQLFARDSSSCQPAAASPAAADGDCVFVRIDNNTHYAAPTSFPEEEEPDDHSIFADALEDAEEEKTRTSRGTSLPDNVRTEILELGLPDDGYNYLLHLREIRKSGAGSNYYENSKSKLDSVPLDVRAYDASRLKSCDGGLCSIYDVATNTVAVKVDKVADPDVARLLDDSDLSRFGSDVEDLEEDFVVRANLLEEDDESEASGLKRTDNTVIHDLGNGDGCISSMKVAELESEYVDRPRLRRPLDEQFDLVLS